MSGYTLGTAWLQVSLSGQGIGKELRQQVSGLDSHIAASTRGWGSSISSGLGGAFKSAAAIGGAALVGATAYLSSYTAEALKASDSAQKFASTLQFAGLDDSKIKDLTESTKKYAAQTVYDITDIRNTTAALAANGIKDYDKLAQAVGNLNAVAGGSAESFKTVGNVITQTVGKQKLVTENWNQLTDAVPGAAKRIRDALTEAGAYTGDFNKAMEDGEITAEEFNDAITKLGFEEAAIKAASSTATFEGAWGNFQATITDGLADLIDVFKGDLTGGISVASDALQAFFTNAKDLASGLRSIFKDGDFTGFGNLGISEDSHIIDFLFDLRENTELFKASLLPIEGLAAGALGPLLSGLPVIGGAFSGLTGPVGLVMGLFAQMYTNSEVFRAGLIDVGDALMTVFAGFAPVIEPIAGIIVSIATSIGDTLGNALIVIAPAIGEVGSALGTTLGTALSSVQPVLDSILAVFDMLVGAATEIIGAVLPQLAPVLTSLGEGFSQLVAAVQPLIDTIISALQPALDAIVPVIIDMATKVFDVINMVLPVAMEIIGVIGQIIVALTPLIETIVGNMIPVVQSILTVVSTVFETIKSVISAALQVVSGIIKVVTGVIKGDWSLVWEGIKQVFSGIWDAIKAVVTGAIAIVSSVISTALGTIKAMWNIAWDTIASFFSGIWERLKSAASSGVSAVYDTVVGIKNKIINFFSGAGSWLSDAGSTIIQGFIDGIYSAFDQVRSTLGELTSLLPDWKGPVQVDRVILKDAGRLVIGGFVDGMESQYGAVEKSLGNLTHHLGDTSFASFDFKGSQSLDAPREIVVVDADGALIGRMQIEAEAVVGRSLAGARRSKLREELGVEEF